MREDISPHYWAGNLTGDPLSSSSQTVTWFARLRVTLCGPFVDGGWDWGILLNVSVDRAARLPGWPADAPCPQRVRNFENCLPSSSTVCPLEIPTKPSGCRLPEAPSTADPERSIVELQLRIPSNVLVHIRAKAVIESPPHTPSNTQHNRTEVFSLSPVDDIYSICVIVVLPFA